MDIYTEVWMSFCLNAYLEKPLFYKCFVMNKLYRLKIINVKVRNSYIKEKFICKVHFSNVGNFSKIQFIRV